MVLKNKKILLGICGSIAAYKSTLLVRELIKEGAEVKVIFSHSASQFVTSLTFSTLSKNPVYSEFTDSNTQVWVNHIELGLWADYFIIAPATAHTLSCFANGICDSLLCTVYLSARCKVAVAPAMDVDMFKHAATKKNLQTLKDYGVKIIPPGTGELASGLTGEGRMAEPEEILSFLRNEFRQNPLSKKKVLITAGPTYEAIDPVRYLGNHSTGTMGYCLADVFAQRNSSVTLISGPVSLEKPSGKIRCLEVVSAEEMKKVCLHEFSKQDIIIMSAAVADFRPVNVSSKKIKKNSAETFHLELVKNPDILYELGKIKKKNQILIGFALETEKNTSSAKEKLKAKNLDMLVFNTLNNSGAGFGKSTNQVTLLFPNGTEKLFPLKSKGEVAEDIADEVERLIKR